MLVIIRYQYFTKDDGNKSACTIYSLAEMYRQGLFVEKDEAEACAFYEEIVYDDSEYAELDDYYWRACYRLGMAKHYGQGIDKDLEEAIQLLAKAKTLYDNHDEAYNPKDITKEELYHEWLMLNQDAGKY